MSAPERLRIWWISRPLAEAGFFHCTFHTAMRRFIPGLRLARCYFINLAESLPERALSPVAAVEAVVLDGFGEVLGEDAVGIVEVGDGAGDFEETVVGTGA